VYCAI